MQADLSGRPAVAGSPSSTDKGQRWNLPIAPGNGVEVDLSTSSNSFLVWQLADSAFPSGGFAHSGGLEAAWKYGQIKTSAALIQFLETSLHQLRHSSLPFVKAAFHKEAALPELDALCDAFTANHVANRASRAQGQAFLNSCRRIFALQAIDELRNLVLAASLPGHFAPLFGAIVRELSLPLRETVNLFVFLQLRSWISAAVRLNIVGPLEAQAIQHQLTREAQQAAANPEQLRLDAIAQTAPLLDLFQGSHYRIYSRLFQS